MIGAGLKDGETEFYWDGPNGYVVKSGIRSGADALSDHDRSIIDSAMTLDHHNALNDWQIFAEDQRRLKFLKCNSSTYDFTPDIKDGKIQLEYVSCSERGICKHEGKFCRALDINGVRITMTQLKIISMIRAGLYDKEICFQLGIAIQTLRTHKQAIEKKMDADRKVQVALKAVEYGII